MPISELHSRTMKEKPESTQSKMPNCSSDLSYMPDEFVELLWDNGPIVMQGQCNRPRKSSLPTPFPSHSSRLQENNSKDTTFPKFGHFRPTEPKVNNFANSKLSPESGVNAQADDLVPWINYPIEDSLHNDYCYEFLNEFSLHSLSADSDNVEQGPSRIRTSQPSQLPQQCQSLVPSTHSRVTDVGINSSSCLMNSATPKQNSVSSKPEQPSSGVGVTNFSHFSRPIARLRSNEKGTGGSNPMESTVIECSADLKSVSGPQGQLASVPKEDSSRKNNIICATNNSSKPPDPLGRQATDKGDEAVVVSSSVSSAGATSSDHKHEKKRKQQEEEESSYQSEDLEDESVALKKPATMKGSSTKRSRAAEVHNLSERRRRDRINERMKALQELIPNCNKTDKASMLDEAIEYLKSLQLQVQIMSMGSGMCMPPMMMPHIRAPPMGHFQPIGVGMGMGMGFGYGYGMGMYDMKGSPNGCPLIPAPSIHGPQFPTCPSIARPPAFNRMFGIPGQGFPVSMSHLPSSGSSLEHSMKASSMAEIARTRSGPGPTSTSRDKQLKNMNLDKVQESCTDDLQMPESSQAAKECFEDSALEQASEQPSLNSY